MIRIHVGPPKQLHCYSGAFTSEYATVVSPVIVTNGAPDEKFNFRRKCEHLIAHLRALEEIDCEATVHCAISQGRFSMEGSIVVWFEPLVPLAESVVSSIKHICEGLCKDAGESTSSIGFALSRKVLRRA